MLVVLMAVEEAVRLVARTEESVSVVEDRPKNNFADLYPSPYPLPQGERDLGLASPTGGEGFEDEVVFWSILGRNRLRCAATIPGSRRAF